MGLTWQPSERTTLSALTGKRSFGNTHNVSFEHRSARTVWRFTDSKDVSTPDEQNGFGTVGNVYDLFYNQLEGSGLTPAERALRVNQLLQQYGINPNIPVVSSFLTSAASVQRSQNGSADGSTRYQAGFDASWEPDLFGGNRATLDAAEASARAAAASLGDVQVSLAAETAVATIELRGLQARLASPDTFRRIGVDPFKERVYAANH